MPPFCAPHHERSLYHQRHLPPANDRPVLDKRRHRSRTSGRSIGCESDPSEELGLNVYLWALIRLVDVWADEGSECAPVAHEQIVRVCACGRIPLASLLHPTFRSSTPSDPRGAVAVAAAAGHGGSAFGRTDAAGRRLPGRAMACTPTTRGNVDAGRILAPLLEKLMRTGHVQEFVDQVRLSLCLTLVRHHMEIL